MRRNNYSTCIVYNIGKLQFSVYCLRIKSIFIAKSHSLMTPRIVNSVERLFDGTGSDCSSVQFPNLKPNSRSLHHAYYFKNPKTCLVAMIKKDYALL